MSLCFHHEQLFGNVFERKLDKCCSVLKYRKRKVKPKIKNLKLKGCNLGK